MDNPKTENSQRQLAVHENGAEAPRIKETGLRARINQLEVQNAELTNALKYHLSAEKRMFADDARKRIDIFFRGRTENEINRLTALAHDIEKKTMQLTVILAKQTTKPPRESRVSWKSGKDAQEMS